MTHPALLNIFKSLFEDVWDVFKSLQDFDRQKFQIILVSYRKTSDSVVYWDLYKYDKAKVKFLSEINIRNGEGTVGFIVWSGKPEMVSNTFEDPRGSVAFADFFIGNKSFFGIPVLDGNDELKFIISFSYDGENIWPQIKNDKEQIINEVENKIKKYKKELLLLNEIQTLKKIQDVFVGDSSNNLSLLNRMMKIVNETVSYSFLVYLQNNQIKQIKVNDSIIENRIFTFLNWCSLFKNSCKNCPIKETTSENDTCNYYTDFLQYLKPFKVLEIPLDDKNYFVLKLYCKNDTEEIKVDGDSIKNLFTPIIALFKQEGIVEVQKKILTEVIHQIISHYITYLINNDESEIKTIPFTDYNIIIESYFKKTIKFNGDKFNKVFLPLKEKLKNRLLLIELWQNNIAGIKISKIISGDAQISDVNSSMNLDRDLSETATVKVLIKPDFILEKDNMENLQYKPLVASKAQESIYKESTKYVIQKEDKSQYEIEWEHNPNLSQLIRIKINSLYLEQYLKNKFSLKELQDKDNFGKNKFFYFNNIKSFANNDSELNLTISLALNCDIEENTKRLIDKFCKNIYESELRNNANIRAAISQVMARNMSHNIGSHVLSKLITPKLIGGIKKDNKTDPKVYQCNSKTEQDNKSENTNDKLIADFFNYLKSRMDYLADVTTVTPVIENVNSLYSNMISPFIQNRALNDRISGITKFNYDIVLCKPDHNDGCINKETKRCNCRIIGHNDIQVSIPNDVVGVHAFYTILENIIRNTAKHATKPEKDKTVEFKIKIEEASYNKKYNKEDIDWNAFYAVSVFDNCPIEGEIDLNTFRHEKEDEKQEFISKYEAIIKNKKINNLEKLVYDQNTKLNETILYDNKLRHGHWGLIEMDASAAYLRKIPVEQIDSEDYNIVDLKGENPITEGIKLAIFQAYNEQGKYLGYRFFLKKPQEILIITNDRDDKDSTLRKSCKSESELINEGIWIKTIDEIETDIKENNGYPHRLIVITVKASKAEKLIKYNPLFSKRIIPNVEVQFDEDDNKKKMWNLYYSELREDYIEESNDKNKRGVQLNHGDEYCEHFYGYKDKNGNEVVRKKKFIENKFSATDIFFDDKLKYKKYWPIRIGIIDERVQAFCKEKYPIEQSSNRACRIDDCYHTNGVPYEVLYKNTNIMVPSVNECDLNEQDFDSETVKIIKFIRECTQITLKEADKGNGLRDSACEFIVIHIGIIEKMIKSWNKKNDTNYNKDDSSKVKAFIEDAILEGLNDKKTIYDTLIITSGRGKPQNLPEDIRYFNFSTVYQYLTVQRNKYALTEALFSARKQTNN